MDVGNELYDLKMLRQITLDDKAAMVKFIAIFLDTAPVIVKKLELNFDNFNLCEIKEIVHSFKPTIVVLGLDKLNIFILTIENATGGDAEYLTQQFINFKDVVRLASAQLEEESKRLAQ